MKQQAKNVRTRTKHPVDLTGMRYGKWTVLKFAGQRVRYYDGQRFSLRMWLCRCDCGVQKEVSHHNLTGGRSTKCQQCSHIRHGIYSEKLYERWRKLRKNGELPKEWENFDVFRKVVGDPPEKKACLKRFDRTKPYSSENVYWMYPALVQNDPALMKRVGQLRKKLREERVAHDETLMRIRNAKSRDERNRCMIAARKAGYSCGLIGIAAKLTTQRVNVIVTASQRRRWSCG
jgi:hypothetical protein